MLVTKFMSVELMPQSDEGVIKVTIEMPAGTNVEATDSVVQIVAFR